MGGPGWYLLVHQLPTEPIYLRAKIGRRLSRVGALALKNSVYVLPRSPESLEDLQWIVEEAKSAGGEAYICEAEFIEGISTTALVRRFREERKADYAALSAEARAVAAAIGGRRGARDTGSDLLARLARLKRRLSEIQTIDFFGAPGRKTSAARLASLEKRLHSSGTTIGTEQGRWAATGLKGRVWATRRGVHIDRIGSAWFIRRFIDPDARFRFIDPAEPARPGELRFDMVDGDFTHVGDACTFEVLAKLLPNPDPGIRHVAEIIHDIDLKDGKFARPDAAGIQQIVSGIVSAWADDDERLARGFALFDDLYASFQKRPLSLEARK